MRELKFRAWDKINKWMDNDFYIFSLTGSAYDKPEVTYDTPHLEIERTDALVVMQDTGAKDCFGSDIFEGDIVFLDSQMITGEIVMDFFAWKIKYGASFEWLCDFHDDLEVIGNIYEHPSLLGCEP